MNDICVYSIRTYEKEISHKYNCQIMTHEVCDEGKSHFSYLDFVKRFAIVFSTMTVDERF
jgi:hypothetical protein